MRRFAILAAALALAATACKRTEAAPPPAALARAGAAPAGPAAGATLPRLVFFQNPNGGPCQAQDAILRELGPALTSRAVVVPIRTTVAEELPYFQRYGIRSLPMLVVTDAAGNELRRATPGVQSPRQVLALVGP